MEEKYPHKIKTEFGPARKDKDGYYHLYWSKKLGGDGRDWRLHKLIYTKKIGPIPRGQQVHHIERVHCGWIRDSAGQWVAKPCTYCKKILPLSAFFKEHRPGRTPTVRCKCKKCQGIVVQSYFKAKREQG